MKLQIHDTRKIANLLDVIEMMKKRTVSNFKPSVKPFTKNQRELLQIGLPLVVVILLFMPMCVTDGTNHPYANSSNEADKRYESSSNLIGVNLPYYVPSIAAGNTTYGRGVAWIFNDTLRFKDPVNLVDASVNIGIGNPFFQTLIGADVDLDGYTEFLFMMSNLTNTNLVVVDFDGGGSATEYNYDSIPDPMEIIVGDFNGDTLIDVGVYSKIRLVTKNLSSDTIIGSLTFSTEEIVKACTGDFSIVAGDEIA
ncbi:MAG: FG-GAP repeat domain-containing protein, partial [Promethearchaeota archaeon]